MCRLIAAALCGVGARLDEDSTLFFSFRGVDTGDLIKWTVSSTADDVAVIEMPVDRTIRMAGVWKTLKKETKKHASSSMKGTPSIKPGVKNWAVKRKAKGAVKKVVNR